jgi:hypothetical protein
MNGEEVNIAKIVKEHSSELLERANEQKPTEWSELEPIIQHLNNLGNTAMADVLSSFQPQPKQEWSEEQIMALRWVLNNVPYNKYKEEISGLIEQIKDFV